MFLPLECLEKLKCCRCNRLLSVFPIYINKYDQKSSVCGRCKLLNNKNYLRCEIYENIAKNVRFPCINKKYGCMHSLLPEDVEHHEKICPYRGECCILAQQTNCKWRGPFNQLYVHYKDEHKELLLKNNQFEFDVYENHNFVNILLFWEEMFLFECSFDQMSKQLKCTIRLLNVSELTCVPYCTQICITSNYKTITTKFPDIDPTKSESININIKTTFGDDVTKVTGTILIVEQEELFDYNTELNQQLLQQMKCFKCKRIIFGSIYNCGGTHYTCERCRTSCCSLTNYHDKATEEAFKLVCYKCPYGCNCIQNSIKIRSHCSFCYYARIDCNQVGKHFCNWQGAKVDFEKHLQNDHRDKILKLNEIVRLDIDQDSTERFISFCYLYKLTVTKDLQKVSFRMERLFCFSDCESFGFRYEISIFDDERIERIRIRLPHDSFRGFNYELYQNQIKDVIFENTLCFRLSILKDEYIFL